MFLAIFVDMELTNSIKRLILDLDDRRKRKEAEAWKAEGSKCVLDLIGHFSLRFLVATPEWLEQHDYNIKQKDRIISIPNRQMERISKMGSAPPVLAVFDMPEYEIPAIDNSTLYLALDTIQDPGNLGTIIRTADWFGIKDIFCSKGTADAFAPKVVMATMGALARVKVHYCDLGLLLSSTAQTEIYGTFLGGENIFETSLSKGGIIVMGNEGSGVSDDISALCTKKLTIPSFPVGESTSESLNVATATAITVTEFRKRIYGKCK